MLNQCRLQYFGPAYCLVEQRKGLSEDELFEEHFLTTGPSS